VKSHQSSQRPSGLRRWAGAVGAILAILTLTVGGTVAGGDLLPAATAAPCPDGSGNTCGPQPTQDPGPTQGNQGGPTTAPNAPQTTVPPNDTGAPTQSQSSNGTGLQGTVQSMPTADNPNGCIVNCGPTQTGPAPTVTQRPPSDGPQSPSTTQGVTTESPSSRQSDLKQDSAARCMAAKLELGLIEGAGGGRAPFPRDPTPGAGGDCNCSDPKPAPRVEEADKDCEKFSFHNTASHPEKMPCGYIYDPDSERTPSSDKSLHDYCTSSPDSFPGGNIRPICARHDMCYEQENRNGTQASEGAFKYRTCNNILQSEFMDYCGSLDWKTKHQCRFTAQIYYLAVTGAHINF
jgi:hypothetical protein